MSSRYSSGSSDTNSDDGDSEDDGFQMLSSKRPPLPSTQTTTKPVSEKMTPRQHSNVPPPDSLQHSSTSSSESSSESEEVEVKERDESSMVALATFRGLGLSPWICDVCNQMGMKTPTPIQCKAVPPTLKGWFSGTVVYLSHLSQ